MMPICINRKGDIFEDSLISLRIKSITLTLIQLHMHLSLQKVKMDFYYYIITGRIIGN